MEERGTMPEQPVDRDDNERNLKLQSPVCGATTAFEYAPNVTTTMI